MKYINTKTGAIVYSDSPVSGGDWVESKEEEKPKKTTTRKRSDKK